MKAKWCFSRCPKFVLIIQTFRWREKSSQCCAAGKRQKKVFYIAAAAAAAYLPSLPFFHKKLYMLMLCSWVAKNWVSFGSATKKWKIAAWMDSEKRAEVVRWVIEDFHVNEKHTMLQSSLWPDFTNVNIFYIKSFCSAS